MADSVIGGGIKILREDGVGDFVKKSLQYSSQKIGQNLSCSGYLGTNVLTRDWDVLILLDTTRLDALNIVASEFDFLTDISSIFSVGATSAEWMAATFKMKYNQIINDTAYLASNGFAQKVFEESDYLLPKPLVCDWNHVSSSDFGRLEHIWYYNQIKDIGHSGGYTPPKYVTDRAISVGRNHDYSRLILHYNQPHSPYTANALDDERELEYFEQKPFDYLKNGGKKSKVFEAYLDELRYVLDSVGVLLNNIDADRVVISSDHGEGFGEYGTYGHPFGSLNPYVRKVPWTITSANDKHTYNPQYEPIKSTKEESKKRDVDDMLEALGYKL
jgi:hypothetical protein